MLRIGRLRRDVAQEAVNAVCDTLDLFDLAVLDHAELQDFGVCWGEHGIRMRVEWSNAGFQLAVEECGQVWVDAKIWFGDFVEVDAKDPAVESKARSAQVVRDRELVEAAPHA